MSDPTIRVLFVDNPAWFAPPISRQTLVFGLFVGGYNLNAGLEPPPPVVSTCPRFDYHPEWIGRALFFGQVPVRGAVTS